MSEVDFFVTALQEENEEEAEDEEEAPSLSDLPLTAAGAGAGEEHGNDRRRSMSEPAEFFEFMMPNNINCSSYSFSWNDIVWPSLSPTADDDLIFCGQLRPLTASPPQPPLPPPPRSLSLLLSPSSTTSVPRRVKTRRSESFNESKIATRSSILKSPCIRPSRSLDYCRLRRSNSSNRSHRTNSDGVSSDRANTSSNSNSRAQPKSPPWYWLMFGPLRFPPAANLELQRTAKSRQSRSPATLFPAAEKVSCDRRGWRLISVLSCKSHGSVPVTTPFHQYC